MPRYMYQDGDGAQASTVRLPTSTAMVLVLVGIGYQKEEGRAQPIAHTGYRFTDMQGTWDGNRCRIIAK